MLAVGFRLGVRWSMNSLEYLEIILKFCLR